MNAAAAAPIGPIARWVLLVCTLAGFVAMHTIGHTGPAAGAHPAAVTAVMPGTAGAVVAMPCPDDHCDGHGGTDPLSVCLAVLQGLAVAALLAVLLLTGLAGHAGPRAATRSTAGAPRAPPVRGTGLTIAATSVLRI